MRQRSLLILLLVLVPAAFLAGRLATDLGGGASEPGGRKVLYYVDPMHPSYKSDKPGIAPDCGMKLEPVYADGAGVSVPTETAAAPGTVKITTDRQQLIGVKVATVEKRPVTQTIRMLGRVSVDETRVYRINATIDGWITKTFSAAAFPEKRFVSPQACQPRWAGSAEKSSWRICPANRGDKVSHRPHPGRPQ